MNRQFDDRVKNAALPVAIALPKFADERRWLETCRRRRRPQRRSTKPHCVRGAPRAGGAATRNVCLRYKIPPATAL